MNEPVFPLGEGDIPGGVLIGPGAEDNEETPTPKEPPGADGFAVETTVTVDNSTPGDLVVEQPISEEVLFASGDSIFILGGSQSGLRIPNEVGWQFLNFTIATGAVRTQRFVMPFTKTVSKITLMQQAALAATSHELAIYNALATVQLRTSGVVATTGFGVQRLTLTLASPLTLIGGTTYTLALQKSGAVGNSQFVGADWGTATILAWNGNNLDNWLSWATVLATPLPAALNPDAGAGSSSPGLLAWLS